MTRWLGLEILGRRLAADVPGPKPARDSVMGFENIRLRLHWLMESEVSAGWRNRPRIAVGLAVLVAGIVESDSLRLSDCYRRWKNEMPVLVVLTLGPEENSGPEAADSQANLPPADWNVASPHWLVQCR